MMKTEAMRNNEAGMTEVLRSAIRDLPPSDEVKALMDSSLFGVRLALASRGTPFGHADTLNLMEQDGNTIGIPVPQLPVSVGSGRREPDGQRADLPVHARGVSRIHCIFSKEGPFIRINDNGSKNGTCVNGESITSEVLCEGDRLQIGEVEFTVVRG